ncbi:hypothetical protein TWF481_010288 [Arthrobotrys musiformis]|uniref:BZIP domain-containing protein n=1 Tax=Arthrobotrys musiformis TaxID=47236 RepID=A0AAV9W6C5_9PEZI
MLSLLSSGLQWDQADDWMGLADAMERRKRQNRINQRAYRNRRHVQRYLSAHTRDERAPDACTKGSELVIVPFQSRFPSTHPLQLITSTDPREHSQVIDFIRRVLLNCSLRLQAPSEPYLLARLNILNAFVTNAGMLSMSFQVLSREDAISPFNLEGPEPLGVPGVNHNSQIPESLRPTSLQREIVHSPWLDLFPIPAIRDRILRGLQQSLITQTDICHHVFAIDSSGDALAPLVVWGEPWDPRSWEFSPELLEAWGSLLYGCPAALEWTNLWRKKRGKRELEFSQI